MATLLKHDTTSLPSESFIPKEAYLSRDFATLERTKIWSKVWQVVGREEELTKVGDYITYNVGDESIIIVRSAKDKIKAYYNVCLHRGRRLTNGCGNTKKFFCRYHGWQWNLDGTNDEVVDREDWGSILNDGNLRLGEVKVDSWGGWVFINMDPKSKPLLDWLAPLPEVFRKHDLENFRYAWYRSVSLPCNWKVALEAFIEGYHATTTHRQTLTYSGDDRFLCESFGPHSLFRFRSPDRLPGHPSPRLNIAAPTDMREALVGNLEQLNTELDSLVTKRAVKAARMMKEKLPESATIMEAMMTYIEIHRELAIADDIAWPDLDFDDLNMIGAAWHIFPNLSMLATHDGILMYRTRPEGDDPDKCILDIWSVESFAPGTHPEVKPEYYERWQDGPWPRIFTQDFINLPDVQKGMKSDYFKGGRPNPIAEATLTNFHKHLYEMLKA